MIEVVHIRTEHDVYGGRLRGGIKLQDCAVGTYDWLGNPFAMGEQSREDSIGKFKQCFWKRINNDPAYRQGVLFLKGKRVACFCKPRHCHVDIINDWIQSRFTFGIGHPMCFRQSTLFGCRK